MKLFYSHAVLHVDQACKYVKYSPMHFNMHQLLHLQKATELSLAQGERLLEIDKNSMELDRSTCQISESVGNFVDTWST